MKRKLKILWITTALLASILVTVIFPEPDSMYLSIIIGFIIGSYIGIND